MASDYFLKIDGIDGSSQDAHYRGWIEVESFTWGVSQTVDQQTTGRGLVSRPQFSSLNIAKLTDRASQQLVQACASGKHFPGGLLVGRRGGEARFDYLKIKLTDVLVSSYQQAGSQGGDDVPMESVSLNFIKIEFAYQEQDPKAGF